ncbi:MAG: MCE family protein [Nonomuraea sp.]|nr:MCE family protein [Nonomuraea sp.]
MRARIWLNLGFFAALGVVMTIWAFSTIIKLDAITKPYRVSAEFASSPGLIRGFDVAYLGVRVGRIGDVRLATGKIVVGLDIDREVKLPEGTTAEVRRKSAIGEPYVELSPPRTGVAVPPLKAGATIPLTRTSVPLDYKKLFEGVGKLLNAVPPKDARTITHELSTALDGRAPTLRKIIDDAHDVTGTLADNSALLDDLSVQLTQLTHPLAGRRDKLATGITDTALVTDALRQSRADLNTFLDQGPTVFGQLDQAIKRSRPGFSCLLYAAGLPHKPIFSAETEKNVHHLLAIVPTALSLKDDVSDVRPDGSVYGRASFIFSVPGGPKPTQEYENALGPPRMEKLRSCPAHAPVDRSDPAAVDDVHHDPYPSQEALEPTEPTSSPSAARRAQGSPAPSAIAADETASHSPLDSTPLIVAIFLAVAACGGIVGWIAVGRAARRREEN